jgi:hypothetical protein
MRNLYRPADGLLKQRERVRTHCCGVDALLQQLARRQRRRASDEGERRAACPQLIDAACPLADDAEAR